MVAAAAAAAALQPPPQLLPAGGDAATWHQTLFGCCATPDRRDFSENISLINSSPFRSFTLDESMIPAPLWLLRHARAQQLQRDNSCHEFSVLLLETNQCFHELLCGRTRHQPLFACSATPGLMRVRINAWPIEEFFYELLGASDPLWLLRHGQWQRFRENRLCIAIASLQLQTFPDNWQSRCTSAGALSAAATIQCFGRRLELSDADASTARQMRAHPASARRMGLALMFHAIPQAPRCCARHHAPSSPCHGRCLQSRSSPTCWSRRAACCRCAREVRRQFSEIA